MIKFQHPNILSGFLLAFLGNLLFSFKSIFIKLAYAQGLNADSVLMLRMAIALPIYLLIISYLYKKNNISNNLIKKNLLLCVFLGFIGYFLASWLDLKGLENISVGLERLTLFTYPIFISLLGALFFNNPLNKKIIITLLLTYSGLGIIFMQEVESGVSELTTIKGISLVLLAALSYSFYVLFSKKIIHAIGSLWFTSLAMSMSSIFVLTYYTISFESDTLIISGQAWIWVTSLAIISTVIPSFLISKAIAKIGSSHTGIVGTMGPIITIILAVFILNEPFTFFYAMGIALILAGILLLILKKT